MSCCRVESNIQMIGAFHVNNNNNPFADVNQRVLFYIHFGIIITQCYAFDTNNVLQNLFCNVGCSYENNGRISYRTLNHLHIHISPILFILAAKVLEKRLLHLLNDCNINFFKEEDQSYD